MHPTGEQYNLRSGDYDAVITQVGATLRTLSFAGRDLVSGFAVDEPMPEFNGALLAPWPNRIADGRYSFDSVTHQLPLSEPARRTALHGLVAWQPWTPVSVDASSVELTTVLYPQRGYPFLLTLSAHYALDAAGLAITITARNDGATDAPYGVSMHPWFVAAEGDLADWTLTLPAASVLNVDARLLPTGVSPVDGALDFRTGRALGAVELDHAFTDLDFLDGTAWASLASPAGQGVRVSWASDCRWLQVCTGDAAGPALRRRAVAIEPMTCAPDAFNSGNGLVRLSPGSSHSVTWTFSAVD